MIKKIWRVTGNIAFWFARPLLVIYLRRSQRTRVVLSHKDKILVVKGWLGDGKWSLPGGGLHRGEDALVGALRELKEETGISLTSDDLISLGDATAGSRGYKFNYTRFYGKVSVRPPVRAQRWEIIDIDWLNPDTLSVLNAESSLIDTLAAWKARDTSATM